MGRKDSLSLEERMEEAKRLIAFGHHIQGLRNERGLSLAEVAQALDVSANYISELERGKKAPSDLMVRELAAYYDGLSENDLYTMLGRIPLYTIEVLQGTPWLTKTLAELKQRHAKKKITLEQMDEILDELIAVYSKHSDLWGDDD